MTGVQQQRQVGHSRDQLNAMSEAEVRQALGGARASAERHFGSEGVSRMTTLNTLCQNPKWSDEDLASAKGYIEGASTLSAEVNAAKKEKFGKDVDFKSAEGVIKPIGSKFSKLMGKAFGMAGGGTGVGGDYATLIAAILMFFGIGKNQEDHKKSITDAVNKYNSDPNNTTKYQAKWDARKEQMSIVDANGKPAPAAVTNKIAGMAMDTSHASGYLASHSSLAPMSPDGSEVSAQPQQSSASSNDLKAAVRVGDPQAPVPNSTLAVKVASAPPSPQRGSAHAPEVAL